MSFSVTLWDNGAGKPNSNLTPVIRPRIIWSYWHDPEVPEFIAACVRSWELNAPGYTIRLLNRNTVKDHIGNVPFWVRKLKPAAVSDWIRLKLIRDVGGIWLDASFILIEPLHKAFPPEALNGDDAFLFQNRKWTRDETYPMMETWFIAAPPGNPLISAWFSAYNLACVNRRIYLRIARIRFGYDAIYQGYPRIRYYTAFAALQCVLRTASFRFNYSDSEDGPYELQNRADYDFEKIARALVEDDIAGLTSIKLAGGERKSTIEMIHRKGVIKGSVLDRIGFG